MKYLNCSTCTTTYTRDAWRASGKLLKDFDLHARVQTCDRCLPTMLEPRRRAELAALGLCASCCDAAAGILAALPLEQALRPSLQDAITAICAPCRTATMQRLARAVSKRMDVCEATKESTLAAVAALDLDGLTVRGLTSTLVRLAKDCPWCAPFEYRAETADVRTGRYAEKQHLFPVQAVSAESIHAHVLQPTSGSWWRRFAATDLDRAGAWFRKRYQHDRADWERTHCGSCDTLFRPKSAHAHGRRFLSALGADAPRFAAFEGWCLHCIAITLVPGTILDGRLCRADADVSGIEFKVRIVPVSELPFWAPEAGTHCRVVERDAQIVCETSAGQVVGTFHDSLQQRLRLELRHGIAWSLIVVGQTAEDYDDLRLLVGLERASVIPRGTALRRRHMQVVENANIKRANQPFEWSNERMRPYDVDLELRWQVLDRDGHRCVYCGKGVHHAPEIFLVIDHIIPWSKGGSSAFHNLAACCNLCNGGKRSSDVRNEIHEVIGARTRAYLATSPQQKLVPPDPDAPTMNVRNLLEMLGLPTKQ